MKQILFFGLVVVSIILSGCSDSIEEEEVAATPESPPAAPLVSERVGESPGKPLSPIGIRYEIVGKPAVGQPLEIRITTQSNVVVRSLTTKVSGDEGLLVSPGSSNFAVAQMSFDEPASRVLTVTPLREGNFALSVVVQGEIDGRIQANNITIPIQVGAVQQERKPTGTLTIDESGEAVISLPAQQN